MSAISQKEYLKKYMSKKGKKKKRKKKPTITEGVNIIDDDIDISKLTSLEEAAELLNTNEDAPQVVGVIDERPMHMRIDDYRKSDLWKPLGAEEAHESSPPRRTLNLNINLSDDDSSPPRRTLNLNINLSSKQRGSRRDDNSPPRKLHKKHSDRSTSPSQHSRKGDSDVDSSPPRRSRRDRSPAPSESPRRRRLDEDISPPRRNRQDSDNSPPRKRDADSSPPRRYKREADSPPQRNQKDTDSSPPRRHKKDSSKRSRWDDGSPKRDKDADHTPPRNRPSTPPHPSTSKAEPPPRKLLPGDKKGKYLIPAKRQKTLDGKTAGLQNAQELVRENEAFRQREDELFKNLSRDVSGANAAPILRDRKTGKIRDLQKEEEELKEKQKKEQEDKEKYSRWGRGLKQVEDYQDRLQQDLHEMSKPLARYADDEDLEKFLKEQEREGDPMLDYIRKKKKKKIVESGKPIKPQYEGEFMPNRFGIAPGYRWDGVDRSTGYEKKWFQVQNSKRAQLEEVYKWSTEDM